MSITLAEAPYVLVPVVTPIAEDPSISGRIKLLRCAPQVSHKWLQSYVDGAGRTQYDIAPRYARKGYMLLRDLFEAEGREADWLEYEAMLKLKAAGKPHKPFPDERLPAEVHRRRACGRDPEPPKSSRSGRASA
ncbi:MAG TPA: hypothetical protein VIK91_11555 [Nannocystis sp.]